MEISSMEFEADVTGAYGETMGWTSTVIVSVVVTVVIVRNWLT